MEREHTPLEIYLAELLSGCCRDDGIRDSCPLQSMGDATLSRCPLDASVNCRNVTAADWLKVLEGKKNDS